MKVLIGSLFILFGVSAFTGFPVGKFLYAFIFILIGLRILTGRSWWRMRREYHSNSHDPIEQDFINEVVVFSALERTYTSSDFKGAKLCVVFAGGEVDLRQVKAKREITLDVVAIFGGLKVIVPDDWQIDSEAVAIAGGLDNKTKGKSTGPIVHLKGVAMLGGVEIVN